MLKLDSDKDVEAFLEPYRIDSPGRISLADHDPGDTDSLPSRKRTRIRESPGQFIGE